VPTLTDIALDAMGSDKAPDPEIKGAIQACRHLPVRVHLVGPEDRLRAALHDATRGHDLPIVIVPAAEWITMDDKAANAIRKKPHSSMRVGLRLVKDGKVAGFLTAGNTGAAMALDPCLVWIVLPSPPCCRRPPVPAVCCSMWAQM
jgi:glycerol-3-phosphate acyltransferase PlsX